MQKQMSEQSPNFVLRCKRLLHFFAVLHVCGQMQGSYPGDYREEREGDSSSGCVCALVERQFIRRGPRPLIGQKAETYKVQEGPETCQKSARKKKKVISKLIVHMKQQVQVLISQILTCSSLFPKNSLISLLTFM